MKPSLYSVFKMDEANRVSGAGAVTQLTASGGTLDLGTTNNGPHAFTQLQVVDAASFAMTATNTDFYVLNRFQAGVLMLCDPTASPGTTTARYVAVALEATSGGHAATQIVNVAELASTTFYEVIDCAYVATSGARQPQNTAHDDQTSILTVAANGDVSIPRTGGGYSATNFQHMLGGTVYNGTRFSAYKFVIQGSERIVLVEQAWFDEMSPIAGRVQLWLAD